MVLVVSYIVRGGRGTANGACGIVSGFCGTLDQGGRIAEGVTGTLRDCGVVDCEHGVIRVVGTTQGGTEVEACTFLPTLTK